MTFTIALESRRRGSPWSTLLLAAAVPALAHAQTCPSPGPIARALVTSEPVALRTPHDVIHHVETNGVPANPLGARFPYMTFGAGTSLKLRDGGTLVAQSETPLLGRIAAGSPLVELADGTFDEFVVREDGVFTRVQLAAGVEQWSVSLRRAGCPTDSLVAAPVVHLRAQASAGFKAVHTDDLVYVGTHYATCAGSNTQNTIVALRASDGATIWSFNNAGLEQVDVVTGAVLDGAFRTVALPGGGTQRFFEHGDRLFATTDRTASVSQSSVWAIDVLTGGELWSQNAGRVVVPPVLSPLHGDRIYVAELAGRIAALSKADGSEIWSIVNSGAPFIAAIAVNERGDEQSIAAIDALGSVWMLRDHGASAEWAWRAQLPTGPVPLDSTSVPSIRAVGTPLLDGAGRVYVGGRDGAVYQLDAVTGEVEANRIIDAARAASIGEIAPAAVPGAVVPTFLLAATSAGQIDKHCMPFCADGHCAGADTDGDAVVDALDNCPLLANPDQLDSNSDGYGDACVPPTTRIHPTAEVGTHFSIGANSSIGARASVGDAATIGSGSRIGADAIVGPGLLMGDLARIATGARVGANVTVGDGAVIATLAVVGDSVAIGAGARVGPGAFVDDRTMLAAGVRIAESVRVGADVRIGAGTVIRAGAIVGAACQIGANVIIRAGVVVPPGTIVPDGAVVR